MRKAFSHVNIKSNIIFLVVVNFYNHNGSDVYACQMDASNAFDMINYSKLFQTVLKRKLHGTIIRLLLDAYSTAVVYKLGAGILRCHIYVKWIEIRWSFLSATLFCIYMDELLALA